MIPIELELQREENSVVVLKLSFVKLAFCKHAGHIYMKGYSVSMIRMISDVMGRKITYLKLEIAGMSHTGGLLCSTAR